MRWLLVVLVAACASSEIKYTATYNNTGSFMITRLALEATAGQGYFVADEKTRMHDYTFQTRPVRLDPADAVEVSFVVQIVYEVQATDRKRFSVLVVPRAYDQGHDVGEARLPPSATNRARQLAAAIREHSRQYEAPAI